MKGTRQVELRDGKGIVVIISLGHGYRYGYYGKRGHDWLSETQEKAFERLEGVEVHFATNGAVQCSLKWWDELTEAIHSAHAILLDGEQAGQG